MRRFLLGVKDRRNRASERQVRVQRKRGSSILGSHMEAEKQVQQLEKGQPERSIKGEMDR